MSNKLLVSAEYFEGFRCLAGECHYNCCRDWRVDINKSAYSKLRSTRMSPELRERVDKDLIRSKKSLNDALYAHMQMQEDGRCSFLTEDGLCALQVECGPGVLPSICRSFPRNVFRIGDVVERSCTMGCEEVVNRLWELPHRLEFICEPLETILFATSIRDTDNRPVLFHRFLEVQTVCVDLFCRMPLIIWISGFLSWAWPSGNLPSWSTPARTASWIPGWRNGPSSPRAMSCGNLWKSSPGSL